jgi:hypothetical protein
MNIKLKEAQKVFEVEKYKKRAMPEVLQYLKDYKATLEDKATAYNSSVIEYINEHETIDADMQDYLGTEVYLAQNDLRAEKETEHEKEMIAQGYTPVRDVGDFTGACVFVGVKSIDFYMGKIDMEGKITKAHDNRPFFIPKGKRTRGYYIETLDNAFYKPLN